MATVLLPVVTLLTAGKRLNPADISLLANLGVDKVDIYKPLIVGLLATGDELVALGEPLNSLAQIYNSNTPTLKSMLSGLPVIIHDYGIIPDDLDKTTAAVTEAMHDCDVLISTAGVSVGRKDFQRGVLSQDDNGNLQVTSFANQQSHRIKQLSNANSLIVLAQVFAS